MITFVSANPAELLKSLQEAIRKGHIATWSEEGGFFTHTPTQWARKAWLRPSVLGGQLKFAIVNPKGSPISVEVYAVYHGRFIETMLVHFDKQFSNSLATAMPAEADRVAA